MRALAAEKGYRVERLPPRGFWELIDDSTNTTAVKPNGASAFTVDQAVRWLRAQGDR